MASVRKLDPSDPKSKWICEYTDIEGRRRRRTPKTGLKKDADALARKIEREMDDGVHVARSQSVTVEYACEEFLRQSEHRLNDGRIGYGRHRCLKIQIDVSIIPYLGRKKLCDLQSSDAELFYQTMVGKGGLSPTTAKDRMRTAALIERFAKKRGWVKELRLGEGMEDLRGIPTTKIRVFSLLEAQTLLSKVLIRDYRLSDRATARQSAMVNIAAFCGLRLGELLGLKAENVDFEQHIIRVRHSMTAEGLLKGPKTRAGVRDVPMPKHVEALLQDWMSRFYVDNPNQLAFTTKAGFRVTAANFREKDWLPLLKRSGLLVDGSKQLHFHALRHFCASWMIDNGMSVMDVARILGHAKFDMTLGTYAHPISSFERRHDLMERMAERLFTPTLPSVSLPPLPAALVDIDA